MTQRKGKQLIWEEVKKDGKLWGTGRGSIRRAVRAPKQSLKCLPLADGSRSKIDLNKLSDWGATTVEYIRKPDLAIELTKRWREEGGVFASRKRNRKTVKSPHVNTIGPALEEAGWFKAISAKDFRKGRIVANKLFAVPKASGLASRPIMDVTVNGNTEKLTKTSCRLADITDIADAAADASYAVSVDGRSWYCQFPVHERLSRLFAAFPDSESEGLPIRAVVMPQGWCLSTRIAQDALTTIARRTSKQIDERGVSSFTYIDNLFVFFKGEDAEVRASQWSLAFEKVTKEVGAEFKEEGRGTQISALGAKIDVQNGTMKAQEEWLKEKFAKAISGVGERSIEAKLRAIGSTIWAARIAGLALGRWCQTTMNWARRPLDVEVPERWREETEKILRKAASPGPVQGSRAKRVVRYAVDATPTHIAAVRWPERTMSDPTEEGTFNESPIVRRAIASVNFSGDREKVTIRDQDVAEMSINRAELLAIALATKDAPEDSWVAILGDSAVAGSWLIRGTGLGTEDIVSRIAKDAERKRLRLIWGHIPSDDNPADKYTRKSIGKVTAEEVWPASETVWKRTMWRS